MEKVGLIVHKKRKGPNKACGFENIKLFNPCTKNYPIDVENGKYCHFPYSDNINLTLI